MLLILITIAHCLSFAFGNSFCPEPIYNGDYISKIYSPEFPLVRPPGPYTCLYHLKSRNSRVEITFSDFLSICSINEPECDNKDLLKIYDGANSSFPLLGEFMLASNKRPPFLLSSGDEMFIEYIVVSIHNKFEFSGFRAICVFLHTLLAVRRLPTSVQTFPIFKKEEELVNFPIEIVEGISDALWLIQLQKTNVILNLNISSNISSYINTYTNILVVRDGFVSTSPVIQYIEFTSAGHYTTLNFTSTNHSLYIRLLSGSSKSFDDLNVAVFSIYTYNEEEKCHNITCGSKETCQVSPVYPIGKHYCECYDGYYHAECEKSGKQRCEEIICANGGTCQFSQSDLICKCPDGFGGDRCEIRNGCYPSFCANGGTCLDTIHATPFCICTPEYYGNNCEHYRPNIDFIDEPDVIKVCPPNYCFNGGTCFHSNDDFYCVCPPRYSGKFCFQKDIQVYKDDTAQVQKYKTNSKLKYLYTLIIPVTFFCVIIFVCNFKKTTARHQNSLRRNGHSNQNSHRRNRHSNENSRSANTLNVDHLPTYEQATRSWQQFAIADPPPKYEDLVIVRDTNFITENTQSQNLENRSRQREEQTRMHSGTILT